MDRPLEFADAVTARIGKNASVSRAWRSLANRLAWTMLPLALLLGGFLAIAPQPSPVQSRHAGEMSFWFHYGALAFCYFLGLHWTEYGRILRAARACLAATAAMTIVTVVLTYAGTLTGMVVLRFLVPFPPPAAAVWLLLIAVPGLAGMAWGIAVAILAQGVLAGREVRRGWLRLHGLWGAAAGPPMFVGAMEVPSLYAPALATSAAALALTLVSWWWLRPGRRRRP